MSIISDLDAHGTVNLEQPHSKEEREKLVSVWPVHMKAAQRGVASAITAGPLLSFPVQLLRFLPPHLHSFLISYRLRYRVFVCFFILSKLDPEHQNLW